MIKTIGNFTIGFAIVFAFCGVVNSSGADKESAVLNIFGNKGQVSANVLVSGRRIGKMKKDGEARSYFSGRIAPGDHVVKLTGNGQELWSQEITAYEGMEYYLDSSEGQTFTPPVYEPPAVKKKTVPEVNIASSPVNPASPAGTQLGVPEENPFAVWGKILKIFKKKPASLPVNPSSSSSSNLTGGQAADKSAGKPAPPATSPEITAGKPSFTSRLGGTTAGTAPFQASEGKPSFPSRLGGTAAGTAALQASEGRPISSSDYQGGSGGIRWIYSPDQVFKLAKSRNKPVMMDFYADSNELCTKQDREVYSSKQIVEMSEKFIAVKVNAERYPSEVSHYKVSGYPTVIFLGSNGTEKARMNGYYDSNEFYKVMSKAAE